METNYKVKGKQGDYRAPTLEINGTIELDQAKVSGALANIIANISSAEQYSRQFKTIK